MSGWLKGQVATVADLFAGTAGMSLAALMTPELRGRARVVHVAELESEYVETIRRNYEFFGDHIGSREQLPERIAPISVGTRAAMDDLHSKSRKSGGLTLLLAGPPCQGFSRANSVTRARENPKNLLALKTIDSIAAAMPRIAIIENVPGIQTMESARRSGVTVSEHMMLRLSELGYCVRTQLLDAADYGVPQHRLRSFIIAIHRKIAHNFDLDKLVPEPKYGPGNRYAYRTVSDALSDLPPISNGSSEPILSYADPATTPLQRELRRYSKALFDHVTTRHSPYVIERFKRIPVGSNWRAIREHLHNYSKPENTHTNIYLRLDPSKPSKTIGNFRKAMTIHPWEHRGLSLREAARLQSLPDWIRFFDETSPIRRGVIAGLSKRQQQVGNAVCFQLTRHLVSHLFSQA